MDFDRGPDGLELQIHNLANALEHRESKSKQLPLSSLSHTHQGKCKETWGLRWAWMLDPVTALWAVGYLESHGWCTTLTALQQPNPSWALYSHRHLSWLSRKAWNPYLEDTATGRNALWLITYIGYLTETTEWRKYISWFVVSGMSIMEEKAWWQEQVRPKWSTASQDSVISWRASAPTRDLWEIFHVQTMEVTICRWLPMLLSPLKTFIDNKWDCCV